VNITNKCAVENYYRLIKKFSRIIIRFFFRVLFLTTICTVTTKSSF